MAAEARSGVVGYGGPFSCRYRAHADGRQSPLLSCGNHRRADCGLASLPLGSQFRLVISPLSSAPTSMASRGLRN